jgi:hypothetical protein
VSRAAHASCSLVQSAALHDSHFVVHDSLRSTHVVAQPFLQPTSPS